MIICFRYIFCSWCLRVHSNVLTGLSLAIGLARFIAWRGAQWRQPRNLGHGDSSLAKIGVIQVSCSYGKLESHIRWCSADHFRHQLLEIFCCTHRPKWSCTTYFVSCLEILYQDCISSANSNPGAGEYKDHLLGIYYPGKPVRDS